MELLGELELSHPQGTWGLSDRIRTLLNKLDGPVQVHIDTITIVDEDERLWDPWCKQLIEKLNHHGVGMVKAPVEKENQEEPTTDLSLLKSVFAGESLSQEAKGDGSLLLVRSEQEWDAADFLTSWLQEHGTERTVLIKDEGSLLLDELLHRRGVAGAGAEGASKWRAVLQVLPLTIDTYWNPIRVERMMELVTIPTSPIPGRIRYRLATAVGFLLFLNEVERDKELNLVAESTDEHSVRVLTYHKAKGLEWPFVILNSLEKSFEKNGPPPVFDRPMAVSTTPFNVEDPLHGRRLYYWPWPYGKTYSKVGLDAHVGEAPELQQRKQQLLDENQRLLYVGMTRARDYLVFAARDFSKVKWIQEMTDISGCQVLSALGVQNEDQEEVPLHNRDGKMIVNGEEFPCKVRVLSIEEATEPSFETKEERELVYVGKTVERVTFVPARFSPSALKSELGTEETDVNLETDTNRIHPIGSRLPLSENPDMALLGEMVHAFLAADNPKFEKVERLSLAQAIRDHYKISALSTDSILEASDRLEEFLSENYPELLKRHSEWPVHLQKGLQKASGWIDLLLLTPKGWVIVDHKSFPGKEADWVTQATSYLPQLCTYAEALHKATGQPVYEAWIHMPVVGAMIHFTEEDLLS